MCTGSLMMLALCLAWERCNLRSKGMVEFVLLLQKTTVRSHHPPVSSAPGNQNLLLAKVCTQMQVHRIRAQINNKRNLKKKGSRRKFQSCMKKKKKKRKQISKQAYHYSTGCGVCYINLKTDSACRHSSEG